MTAYQNTHVEIFEAPDPRNLKAGSVIAFDYTSLAYHLGLNTKTLTHCIINRASLYNVHRISKKSGGTRLIHAPNKLLRYVQRRLLAEVFTAVEYPDHITAYVPGRNITHAARQHSGNKTFLVIDIKDFFNSTRRSHVTHMLQTEFGYTHVVAAGIADLVTVPHEFDYGKRYVVPQGAPTSGAVCNWVAHSRFDRKILALCEKYSMNYTRYADDLAFSNEKKLSNKKTNTFIREVYTILREAGFRPNKKKTRVQRRGRQQRLLGMTINEKPNVMRHKYKQMRARLHHVEHKGFDAVAAEMGVVSGQALRSQIEGTIHYYRMINPDKANNLHRQLMRIDGVLE